MKTTFHKTERHGHIDLFFIGSCRISLLPEPPKNEVPACVDESCTGCETHPTEEPTTEPTEDTEAEKTYQYAKLFVRQGLRTHMIEIPTEHKVDPKTFVSVFTCPYDDLPQYLASGSPVEQWLAEVRDDYLGSIDPVESTEEE